MARYRLIVFSHHALESKGAPHYSLDVSLLRPRPGLEGLEDWDIQFKHLGDPDAARWFREQGRDPRPAVLLFNGLNALRTPAASAILWHNIKRVRAPQILYWHDTAHVLRAFDGREGRGRRDRWARRAKAAWIRYLFDNELSRHWTVSRMSKQLVMFYTGAPPDRVRVVGEAIDLASFAPREGRAAVPAVWRGCGAADPSYRKGFDLFLDVARAFADAPAPPFEFDWFGADEALLRTWNMRWVGDRLASTKVRFRGFAPDLAARMADYGFFLLTSRDDPFPIVTLFALASDIPVFCFDAVGPAEFLPPEFVSHDAAGMAEQVRRYTGQPGRYPAGFFRALAEPFEAGRFRLRCAGLLEQVRITTHGEGRKTS